MTVCEYCRKPQNRWGEPCLSSLHGHFAIVESNMAIGTAPSGLQAFPVGGFTVSRTAEKPRPDLRLIEGGKA